MSERGKLILTGVVAMGVVGATVAGGHSIFSLFSGGDHGQPTMRTMAGLKDFDRVTLKGPDNVVVTRGKSFSVRAEGDAKEIDRLKLHVENGVLHVERAKHNGWIGGVRPTTIRIVLPQLTQADLVGSGNMRIDWMKGTQVNASVTGTGNLWIGDLNAQKVVLGLSGSGNLTVAGHADDVTVNQTGSGNLIAGRLDADTASIKLVGSGNITAKAHDRAAIEILGSGNAHVDGTTECRISRTGSGEGTCKT